MAGDHAFCFIDRERLCTSSCKAFEDREKTCVLLQRARQISSSLQELVSVFKTRAPQKP